MLDVLTVAPFRPEGRKLDERLSEITIRHLLQHTGGWDRNKSGDVVFQNARIAKALGIPSPPTARDVIREVLSRPLDFTPGSRYVYSNFGYCVLGRVIEDVSGRAYGAYVQEHVLDPAGIHGPKLGATFVPAEGETWYHSLDKDGRPIMASSAFATVPGKVLAPYGAWCLEHMDSLGGWIACAEDMVRFVMSLDDPGPTSPFKNPTTLAAMLEPPPGPLGHDDKGKPLERSYACGFRISRGKDGVSFNHFGSLAGTSTMLMHRADGWCWAIFFNRSLAKPVREALMEKVQKLWTA